MNLAKFPLGIVIIVVAGAIFFSCHARAELIIKKPEQQTRFTFTNKQITESSGLACSTRNSELLWTHNDSGHMPIIYAVDDQGRDRGTYHLDDIESIDWEDMDAFQYQGNHYLLIADTGDNLNMLLGHRISIIREPELNNVGRSTISPEWSFFFQYEDGQAYDVESVAVDIVREKIVLLTKKTKPTLMFELPLKPENDAGIQQAVKVASFAEIVNPSALDITADGRLMSINTYRRIHRYQRENPGERWQYEYSLKYKKMFQPEAMCLSKNKRHYFVSSEKKKSLLKIGIKTSEK